jgi:hypothetical protein
VGNDRLTDVGNMEDGRADVAKQDFSTIERYVNVMERV